MMVNINTYIDELRKKKVVTEAEIKLMQRRLNDGKIAHAGIFGDSWKPFMITNAQTEKGLKYLLNQWRGKSGAERMHNPFGLREQDILENFDHFELIDFFDDVTSFQNSAGIRHYIPIYRVVAKDGGSFEYHMGQGRVNIIG
jgi:hypothetical protein